MSILSWGIEAILCFIWHLELLVRHQQCQGTSSEVEGNIFRSVLLFQLSDFFLFHDYSSASTFAGICNSNIEFFKHQQPKFHLGFEQSSWAPSAAHNTYTTTANKYCEIRILQAGFLMNRTICSFTLLLWFYLWFL